MSTGEKKPLAEARAIAEEFVSLIAKDCDVVEIAGSCRRGKAMVGDIEIVARPKWRQLHARLETMVFNGVASKAFYGVSNSNRWGEKYKGLMYKDVKIEVFTADVHNWGYVYWLRTGPAESNAWVMQRLLMGKSAYRAHEGYWRLGERKISVPDEHEMFRLLGMGYIEPSSRTLDRYEAGMKWFKSVGDLTFVEDNSPKQTGMF